MLQIGSTDAFEREYMQRFRALAAHFGEFVTYERDRGARDIGLHLTYKLASGKEHVSSALCWFQMKGLMNATLSVDEFKSSSEIKVVLDVGHLRFWFLQPTPTYLVVYVQSVDRFIILNIQDYVDKKWGTTILTLDQKTTTVRVPTASVLDEQAFNLLLIKSDVEQWKRLLATDEASARLCRRDYDLIWHFGTANERGVSHRGIFWDWQSKLRGQFYIEERQSKAENWAGLREHWQSNMRVEELETAYPYLEFFAPEVAEGEECWWDEDEAENNEVPKVSLANGDSVGGSNCGDEYFEYEFGARLNDLGKQLFESIATLERIGLIEITPGKKGWISVAPWHSRAI